MDHPRDEHQITQRVRRGGTWIACAQVASQVWGFLILAILYRWVGNVPYGLLGMVLVPVALARIFLTSGLDVAAVQDEKLTEDQLSALFWMNQILGGVTALAIACSAPLLAVFYHEPRVAPVAWAMAGTTVVTAVGLQHQALLQRRLRLGVLAVLRVLSQLVGGVAAVAVAWSIGGVWALVTQQYAELVTLAALAWWFEPWRPRLRLFRAGTRRLLRFGTNYTLSSLMFFLSTNIDKALVGHFFGASVLGLYGQAFNLAMKPVHTIVTPLTGIMLPALSRAQNDRRAYHRLLRSFVRFLALSLMPCGVGLALTAPEAILVLGGKNWAAAGTMLAVLAVMIPFQGVLNALGSVYASVGRADRLAVASCGVAGALTAAFVAACFGPHEGAGVRMAVAYTATLAVVIFSPYLWWALHTVGMSIKDLAKECFRPVWASGVMGGIVLAVKIGLPQLVSMRPELWLLVEVSVGVAVYAVLMRRDLFVLWKHGKEAVLSLR